MSVQVQQTPNPNALKFVLPTALFPQPISFAGANSAAAHPLASVLFALDGVYNVFMVRDFVTVNKRPDVAWELLQGPIVAAIEAYLLVRKDGR